MKRDKVVSSNINSIGYEEKNTLLEIEFYNQTVWQYHPVPKAIYLTLMASDSVGKSFNQLIKNDKSIKSHQMS